MLLPEANQHFWRCWNSVLNRVVVQGVTDQETGEEGDTLRMTGGRVSQAED